MNVLPVKLAALVLGFAAILSARDGRSPAASDQPDGLTQGKAIFVSRCSQCHNDDANKKLPDGTTLLARLAQSKDPESRLATRLKDPDERRQVMRYLQSLMSHLKPS